MGGWLYNADGIASLKTGKYSDYLITCKGFEFKVHKLVLSSSSKFFEVCIDGEFKESDGALDLPEQEPRIVAMALLYMYTGVYSEQTMEKIWPSLVGISDGTTDDNEAKDQTLEQEETGSQDEIEEPTEHADQGQDQTEEPEADEVQSEYWEQDFDDTFIESRIKLYKFADVLMLPQLRADVIQEIFKYAQGPLLEDDPCDCVDGWSCVHTTRYNYERHYLKTAGLSLSLLEKVYEQLPEDDNLRARAVVATLEATRSLPYPDPRPCTGSNYDWSGPNASQRQEVLESLKLKSRMSKLLKKHDLVAYNVARHYRKAMEKLVASYEDNLSQLRCGTKNVDVSSLHQATRFNNVGRALNPVYQNDDSEEDDGDADAMVDPNRNKRSLTGW